MFISKYYPVPNKSISNDSQFKFDYFLSVFQVYLKVLSLYLLLAVSNQCRAKLMHRTLSFRDSVCFYQNMPARLVEHIVCSYK